MPGDRNTPSWEINDLGQRIQNRNTNTIAGTFAVLATVLSSARSSTSEECDISDNDNQDVQTDGSTSTDSRDPPGQSSVYIPPGNHWVEEYRLVTFTRCLSQIPISVNDLAASGFYYTGFRDRVKCFSCGISVENWTAGDDPSDTRWHKSDCPIIRGMEDSNVPLLTTRLKRIFRGILQPSPAQSYSPVMACGSQQRTAYQSTTNQGWGSQGLPDAVNLSSAAAPLNTRQLLPPHLRIGDIHSPEHERLIYSLDLKKEKDRRKTFAKWPSYPAPELAHKLPEEGFFYLGNLDRVQCFSCFGVLRNWTKNDNPRTEHKRHFPNCRIVLGLVTENIPMTISERRILNEEEQHRIAAILDIPALEPADPPIEEQRFLANHFPCLNPVNPQMQSEASRIATFTSAWPAHKVRATPEHIARAGFFFLGQGDKTKCFYCNGGLQNWEANDEPWTEHSKWFPGCEYVNRRKGTAFTRGLYEAHPNLSRPPIRNPVSFDIRYVSQPSVPTPMVVETVVKVPAIPALAASRETQNAKDTLNELLSERICKGCFKETAENLAQPCGHIALCSSCISSHPKCPLCKIKIESTIKVYRI